MFLRTSRILMNAADASTNSGSGAPAAPAPNEAPASVAPAALDEATRKAIVDETRNSIFAELRRNGALNEKKTKTAPADPAQPSSVNLRSLDRAIARAGRTPDESAYRRMERAFTEEAPDNPDSWLADYFSGLGIPNASTPAANTATTTTTTPRSATPVSDGGSPPVPRVPLEQARIMSLSVADREHLIKQKGAAWYRATIAEQEKDTLIRIK
jgi:hypothetical protein